MKKCFECGKEGDVHEHHVVPRSKGGRMTIPLCEGCHGLVHDKAMNIKYLSTMGLANKRRVDICYTFFNILFTKASVSETAYAMELSVNTVKGMLKTATSLRLPDFILLLEGVVKVNKRVKADVAQAYNCAHDKNGIAPSTIISEETKDAIRRVGLAMNNNKQYRVKLGNVSNLSSAGRSKGAAQMKSKSISNQNNRDAFKRIVELKNKDMSFNQIAKELNEGGFLTAKNCQFNAIQVIRIYKKMEQYSKESK